MYAMRVPLGPYKLHLWFDNGAHGVWVENTLGVGNVLHSQMLCAPVDRQNLASNVCSGRTEQKDGRVCDVLYVAQSARWNRHKFVPIE